MPVVNVKFRNVATGVVTDSRADDSNTVGEVVAGLVQQGLIASPKEGQHYVLQVKGKAELSDDNSTLQSGGVKDGDQIDVALTQRGGGEAHA